MKLQIVSDLHLEFGPIKIERQPDVDALILSGDIQTASHFRTEFFDQVSGEFEKVFYVPGNHEFYGGDIVHTQDRLHDWCKQLYPNVVFLPTSGPYVYKDYTFLGNTLWTDMNQNDSDTKFECKMRMNDFLKIEYDGCRLTPDNVVDIHDDQMNRLIQGISAFGQNYVIVGHHAPSKKSTHPRYKFDVLLNGAYSSNLERLMAPEVKLWTHGHTHHSFDYTINQTRVVCNPRGYDGYDLNDDFDPNMVIDLDSDTGH